MNTTTPRHGQRLVRGRRGTRSRLGTAVVLAVAVVASLLAVDPAEARPTAPSQDAPASPAAATIRVVATPTSAAAPGAIATANVAVINSGLATAAAPVTVSFAGLPAGAALGALVSTEADQAWSCAAATGEGTCTLVAPGTTTPIALDGETGAFATLDLDLTGLADVGPGIDLSVLAEVGPDTAPAPDLTDAELAATFSPLAAGTAGSLSITDRMPEILEVSTEGSGDLVVRNLGPAAIGGPGAPVVLSGIVPAGTTGGRAVGDGWTCGGNPLGCTWTGEAVGVGGSLPPLTVTFTAPAKAVSTAIVTNRTVTAIAAGAAGQPAIQATARHEFTVIDTAAPDVWLAAEAPISGIEPPGDVTTDVVVGGSGLEAPEGGIRVAAVPPAGFTYRSVTGAGWTCAPGAAGGTAVLCSLPGLAEAEESSFTLRWAVATGTPAGPANVLLAAMVDGQSEADAADDQASVEYSIARPPAAAVTLRTWHYPGNRASSADDGRALVVTPGRVAQIGIDGTNTGSSPLAAGTKLRLTTTLPKGTKATKVATDSGGPAWTCATSSPAAASSTQLVCTTTLKTAVPVSGAIPRLRVHLTVPNSATLGPAAWRISLLASHEGVNQPHLAAVTSKAVTVVRPVVTKADPTVSIEVLDAARRGGRTGKVRVSYGNGGTATGPGTVIFVYLPAGVHVTGTLPAGCFHSPKYFHPSRAMCWVPGQAPGASTSMEIRTKAVSNARPDGTARADAHFATGDPVKSEARMVLLDALWARAEAAPGTVTSPALGGVASTVLLDGRASQASAADATWRQIRAAGDPAVVWDGEEGATSVSGLTASFTTPVVTQTTVLRFRLTLADGVTTSSTDVSVTVEPVPDVGDGEEIGWDVADGFGRLRAELAESRAAADGPGVLTAVEDDEVDTNWVITDWPNIQINDTGGPTPVIGSRVRLHNAPTYRWDGPGIEPSNATASFVWEQCYLDYAGGWEEPPTYTDCFTIGTEPVMIVPDNNVGLRFRFVITWSRLGEEPQEESFTWDVGEVGSDYSLPENMVPPSLSGTAEVGETLVGDPGEWTLEFAKQFSWSRCVPGSDPLACTEIDGAMDSTYVVGAEDRGSVLRFTVQARSREGQWTAPYSALSATVPGDTDCRGACWRFDEQPEVSAHPDGSSPVTAGFAAEILTDGRATWLDPGNEPTDVTYVRSWRQCLVSDPGDCTTASGSSYTPQRVGVTLQAVVTVEAVYPLTGELERKEAVVDLGEVQAPDTPPVNLTRPTVSGTPMPGETLTVDPGTWTYALRGDGPAGSEFAYRWLRCGYSGCVDTSVTTPTYLVSDADHGQYAGWFLVEVTARGLEPEWNATAQTDFTVPITAPAKRVFSDPSYFASGELAPGTWLSLVPAGFSEMPFSDLGGPEITWERCRETPAEGAGPPSLVCAVIEDARYDSYRLTLDDVGHRIRVSQREVAGGNETIARSSLIDVGEVAPPATEVSAATNLPDDEVSIPNSGVYTIVGLPGGEDPLRTAWTQESGPEVDLLVDGEELTIQAPEEGNGELVFRYSVEDGIGRTAHVDVTVTYGEIDVPGLVCELMNTITGSGVGPKSFSLGSTMTLGFSNASLTGGFCGEHTVVTITGATVTLYDWLEITAEEVVITPDGVSFDGVQLAALDDAALGGVTFQVVGDLSVPFEGDLDELELTGSVIADGIPFVTLPGSWRGAEMLTFSSEDDVQAIGFDALAYHDPGGEPVEIDGGLPTPPEDAATLEFSGRLASDRTFALSVAAEGLVTFADSGIDFAGSIERAEPDGDVAITVLGELAAPVALASGVRLESAGLGWDGTTFEGQGELSVEANDSELTVAAAFSFSNPRAWQASLSLGAAGTWEPAAGISITDPSISGEIARDGATTGISLAAEVGQIGLGSKARIEGLRLALDATCTAGASCAPTITLSGAVQADLASGSLRVSVLGSLDLTEGVFSLEGTVGSFEAMPGLSVGGATFAVTAGPRSRSVSFTASATVLGTPATVTLAYDDDGLFVQAGVGRWTPFNGAPTLNSTDVVYSTAPRTVEIGGQDLEVPAHTVYLTASSTPPAWFNDLLGTEITSAVVGGSVNLRTFDIDLSVRFEVPNATLIDTGGVRVRLSSASFMVRSVGGVVSVGLGADAELRLPGIGGGSTTTVVSLTGSFAVTTGQFTASIFKPGVWSDAFGIPGLSVRDLALSLSLRPGSIPSVGLAGGVVLPKVWSDKIGMANGAEVKLAAALGGASNCIGFEIGRAGATSNVIDVANLGAVTARHAAFYLSDAGCEIGPHRISPGLTLAFDGALLGTPVWVQAAVTPTPFSIKAEVKIGNFDVAGFGLKDTYLKVDLSPTTQAVEFRARATILGVTAAVEGAFSRTAAGLKLDFAGQFATPSLGGFALDRLDVAFSLTTGSTTKLTASAAANVRILGQPQAVAFDLTITNGKITRIAGSAAVDIQVSPVRVVGNANVVLVQGQFPTISIAGRVEASGYPLGSASLVVQPNGLQVSASLNLPTLFQKSPSLSGTIAWPATSSAPALKIVNRAGQTVNATPGSFRFDVKDVGLSVAGFGLNANITVASVDGVAWADLDTKVRLGVDSTNAEITFKGSFASTGRVDLTGSGSVTLAGFSLAGATFSLSNANGTLSLGVQAGVAIPRFGSVQLAGSFRRDSAGTWFELTGTGALRPGGYNLGTGTFTLYRRPAETAFKARGNLNMAGLASASVLVNISSTGSMEFAVKLAVNGHLGQVLGRPTASVNFRSGPVRLLMLKPRPYPVMFVAEYVEIGWVTSLGFNASTTKAFGIASFAVSGVVTAAGDYHLQASASAGPWSSRRDLGFCTGYLKAGGSLNATVIGGANSLSITLGLDASVSAGCGSLSVGAGVTADFRYTAPNSFSGTVKGRVSAGPIGTWRPTLFTINT